MSGKKKKKEQSSLHLTDKKHPASGIAALLLSIVSIAAFVGICFVSSESHGKAGILIGLAGLLCFGLSAFCLILSWLTLLKENIRTLFPTLAAIISGLSTVFYLLLYIWGTFI